MAKKNDPVQILKRDHKRVRDLLTRAVETEGDSEVLSELVEAIELHTQLEEELVYPAFLQAAEGSEHEHLYYESLEEHTLVDEVLAEIDPEELEAPVLMAKIKVVKDLVTHHIQEEEKQLFPLARKLCSKEELAEIGDQLAEAFGESTAKAGETKRAASGSSSKRKAQAEKGKAGARVDLNHASAEELAQIRGIDGIRAGRIIEYRESHGPFHSWDELHEIEGFDDGMIRTVRSQSSLGR